MKKLGWLFVLLPTLIFSDCPCKNRQQQPPPPVAVPIEGKAWVQKMIALYPEIEWLGSAHKKPPISSAASYSEEIFGQKFAEFDRLVMSLYCLDLILDGSDQAYQKFTASQPESVKLSKESFRALHSQCSAILRSRFFGSFPFEMRQALETTIILKALCKSVKSREIFNETSLSFEQTLQLLQKNPQLSPSFAKLSLRSKHRISKASGLVPYDPITHLEGGPALFSPLKQSNLLAMDPEAWSFDLYVHICDTAGSLGDLNRHSSLAYTENTHRAFEAAANSCRLLTNPLKSESDAYDDYLATRAAWVGFNPAHSEERLLTRIAAMLELFTPVEGMELKKSIMLLSEQGRERIITQLSQTSYPAPRHLSEVLVNLSHFSQPPGIASAVVRGLPFLTAVLEQAPHEVPLNFSSIAEIAKKSPDLLLQKSFNINGGGHVTINP